jgi:hypothetical protein
MNVAQDTRKREREGGRERERKREREKKRERERKKERESVSDSNAYLTTMTVQFD